MKTVTYVVIWRSNFSAHNEEDFRTHLGALQHYEALLRDLPERQRGSVRCVKRTVIEEPYNLNTGESDESKSVP